MVVRPSEGMPGSSPVPGALRELEAPVTPAGEGAQEPRDSGVPGCPEAGDELSLRIKNALFSRVLAAALAEGRGLGPEPGARRPSGCIGPGPSG